MKSFQTRICYKSIFLLILSFSLKPAFAQKSDFWNHVQFGGAFALSLTNGYTEITLAPGAIYNFNQYVAFGTGLQGTYISSPSYDSTIFGGNLIALFNPIREIQLSTEVEELHVHNSQTNNYGNSFNDDFWNTALFLGAGYRANNVTIGMRYNILYNKNNSIYSDPFMPFIRVYF